MLIGYLCLFILIPWSLNRKDAIRTEFLSGKAAYWTIMSGLVLLLSTSVVALVRFLWSK